MPPSLKTRALIDNYVPVQRIYIYIYDGQIISIYTEYIVTTKAR